MPVFTVEPNKPEDCILDVVGAESCGLLEPPKLRPLEPLLLPKEKGCEPDDSTFFPNRLVLSAAGLLNRLGAAVPIPVLGGGPAGVVELAKKLIGGLLVGVLVVPGAAEDAFEPKLPNSPPEVPPPPVPPNRLGVCPCPLVDESAGLFGVENPEKLFEGAALLDVWPPCDAG